VLELRPDGAVGGILAAATAGAVALLVNAPIPPAGAIGLALLAAVAGLRAIRSQCFGRNPGAPRALILTSDAGWMAESADGKRLPLRAPLAATRVLRWWFLRWHGTWIVVTARTSGERAWRQLTSRLRERAHEASTPHAVSGRG